MVVSPRQTTDAMSSTLGESKDKIRKVGEKGKSP